VVDAAALVEREIRVLRALHVDVGMQRLDRRQRCRLLDHRDIVDDLERRHLAGTLILGEGDRPLLGDVAVAGHGHHEQIAERAGLLEMRQVTRVDQVERAVTVDDPPVRGSARESAAGRRR